MDNWWYVTFLDDHRNDLTDLQEFPFPYKMPEKTILKMVVIELIEFQLIINNF